MEDNRQQCKATRRHKGELKEEVSSLLRVITSKSKFRQLFPMLKSNLELLLLFHVDQVRKYISIQIIKRLGCVFGELAFCRKTTHILSFACCLLQWLCSMESCNVSCQCCRGNTLGCLFPDSLQQPRDLCRPASFSLQADCPEPWWGQLGKIWDNQWAALHCSRQVGLHRAVTRRCWILWNYKAAQCAYECMLLSFAAMWAAAFTV